MFCVNYIGCICIWVHFICSAACIILYLNLLWNNKLTIAFYSSIKRIVKFQTEFWYEIKLNFMSCVMRCDCA